MVRKWHTMRPLPKPIDKLLSSLRELKEIKEDSEISDIWKEALSLPGILALSVVSVAVITVFKIREDKIASLPSYAQLRVRRHDKRIHARIDRRKRPILRHARIRVRRSRIL